LTRLSENPAEYKGEIRVAVENAKKRVARFAGASLDDLVLVQNLTVGMNMIAKG
jgi:selenocysteine lyase/cysteine desulfurase